MIKEFWQERKEEKRKNKELKKQNKKLPKSKEQRAYKVFGWLFAFFLIFSSVSITCNITGDIGDYSWDSLIGINHELKQELSKSVNRSDLLFNKEIGEDDWLDCISLIEESELDIITENTLDLEKAMLDSCKLHKTITFKERTFAAFINQLIESSSFADDVDLVGLTLYQDGINTMMKSLAYVDLSAMVLSSNLPKVYMTTISKIEIHNDNLYCIDTTIKINDFDEDTNDSVLEVLEKSSFIGLDYLTHELISKEINDFSNMISADLDIVGVSIKFLPESI